jgi:predicted LPLAT superfamily acyltransferase
MFVVNTFGNRICSWVLFPVTFYFYLTGTKARRASAKFLKYHQEYCIKHQIKTKPLRPWSVLNHFYEFSLAGLDKVRVWQNKITKADVTIIFGEDCEEIIESGVGFILIASHLGNMEVIRILSPQRKNLVMNAIAYTNHAQNFNKLLKSINPHSNVKIFEVSEISITTSMVLREKIEMG